VALELGGVAVADPLREAAAIAFGSRSFRHELVPVVGIRREDASVAHDEGHPGRVQPILQELEGPSQVALPAIGVPRQEQIEPPGARLDEHLGHGRGAPDGGPAVGHLEDQSSVDEAVALDEAILLFALAGRSEAVVLPCGGLADPAGYPEPTDVVERPRQSVDAALAFRGVGIPVIFALPARASRRICSRPSG
jgi:hypothetical protein